MARPLALERALSPARQREFLERRARGATRAELRAWLAERAARRLARAEACAHAAADVFVADFFAPYAGLMAARVRLRDALAELRAAVAHAYRRLARARDRFASAAVFEADRDPPEALAEQLAALQARAVAVVGENHPAPVSEYLLRLLELRLAERLERGDLDARELGVAVETVVTIATARAKFPSRPADAPKKLVIPPGTVEFIRTIYGLAPDPPGSPSGMPNGPDRAASSYKAAPLAGAVRVPGPPQRPRRRG